MRFIALAILLTVAQACAGLQFHDSQYSQEQIRDELWNVAPGGISLWEYQPPELPIRVFVPDPSMEKRVGLAVKDWNEAICGCEVLRIIDPEVEDEFDMAVIDASEDDDPGRDQNMNGVTQVLPANGFKYELVAIVVLFNQSNETLMHELGHALGLDHDELNRHSVMFPYSSGRILPDVEAIDIEALRWVFGL